MNKHTIICIVLIVLLPMMFVLCFVPHVTRFDRVMNAVKLDDEGNVLDVVQLHVAASKTDYLLGETQLSYHISDFDTLYSFEYEESVPISKRGYFYELTGASGTSAVGTVLCDVYCSSELDRWLLWNLNEDIFYVASSDSDASASDLLSFFSEVIGDSRIPTAALGGASQAEQIDWTLYGTLVTGAGEVTETLALSIRGTVTLGEDGCDTLELDIVLPESFEYRYNGPATYPSENRKYFPELPYCVCPTYCFVPSLNDSVFSVFALSLEKEFVIFNWEDGVDVYLVASTDPDADPQEILAFFDGYIEEYVIDD